MKLPTDTCCALGALSRARGVKSSCVTIKSISSVKFAIATFTTVISVNPAFFTLFRNTDAPIALDPIPASHANTIL